MKSKVSVPAAPVASAVADGRTHRPPHRTTLLRPWAALALVGATLAGCAVQQPAPPPRYVQQPQPIYSQYAQVGQVVAIDRVRLGRPTSGGGAIIGGVAGAVIGNQVGRGMGRDVATVVGALGGAVAGNAIEQNRNGEGQEVFRISVRLNDGNVRAFDYEQPGNIRVGDRVRIEDNRIFIY
jgi:outer membrane lipoprotein SlyB